MRSRSDDWWLRHALYITQVRKSTGVMLPCFGAFTSAFSLDVTLLSFLVSLGVTWCHCQFILLGHWAFFLGVTLLSFLSLSFTLLLSCVTCFFLLSFFFVSWCHSQTCSTFTPLCFVLGITLLFLVPGVTLLSFWMSPRNKEIPKKQLESKVRKIDLSVMWQ